MGWCTRGSTAARWAQRDPATRTLVPLQSGGAVWGGGEVGVGWGGVGWGGGHASGVRSGAPVAGTAGHAAQSSSRMAPLLVPLSRHPAAAHCWLAQSACSRMALPHDAPCSRGSTMGRRAHRAASSLRLTPRWASGTTAAPGWRATLPISERTCRPRTAPLSPPSRRGPPCGRRQRRGRRAYRCGGAGRRVRAGGRTRGPRLATGPAVNANERLCGVLPASAAGGKNVLSAQACTKQEPLAYPAPSLCPSCITRGAPGCLQRVRAPAGALSRAAQG